MELLDYGHIIIEFHEVVWFSFSLRLCFMLILAINCSCCYMMNILVHTVSVSQWLLYCLQCFCICLSSGRLSGSCDGPQIFS